jgi:hypothetical protein
MIFRMTLINKNAIIGEMSSIILFPMDDLEMRFRIGPNIGSVN